MKNAIVRLLDAFADAFTAWAETTTANLERRHLTAWAEGYQQGRDDERARRAPSCPIRNCPACKAGTHAPIPKEPKA